MITGQWIKHGTAVPTAIQEEWDRWLKDNFDPGNWNAYKDKSHSDHKGTGEYHVDVFMPEYLWKKWQDSREADK